MTPGGNSALFGPPFVHAVRQSALDGASIRSGLEVWG